MVHNDLCVGIDLGTTNSVIATCSLDGSRIETPVSRIERYEDMSSGNNYRKSSRDLLPSCVYYADMKDGNYEPIVGDFAKTVSFTQPFAVAKSIKRQMGRPTVDIPGWNPEYPDQTPEAVSARILRHMLASLEDYYGEEIVDAVITVPASFDPAQREATLRAAEIAGLQVREEDGSYRDDILISEPEAVLYDVLNQVQNGKINVPINFSDAQKVLVFDIGGGTLDITLHEISRAGEHFEIRPLATNRFSTIAGDQCDQTLAEWMYRQYIEYYRLQSAEIAKRIEDNPQSRIPFLAYAEELKVKVSNQYKDRQKRGKPLAKDQTFDYGGFMPNGYNSENDMTLEEFESVLAPLLGNSYSYDDYKRFEEIRDDKNIIFPVLNVLYKAAKKLGTDTVSVDAVVLNGGMSRLYLIEERLTRFFGLRPITVNDPDKSVAQGASVYHHYLHQSDSGVLRDMHRRFLEEQEQLDHKEPKGLFQTPAPDSAPNIRSMASIVNEAIYLGAKGGAVHLLVNSGEDLPYQSPAILEFGIAAGQTRLRIPIKQAVTGGEYRTIASGDIEFKKQINHETRVAIQFLLRRNGILTLQAWTYSDDIGMKVIERGSVTLDFNTASSEYTSSRRGRKVLPPSGSNLIVANELSSFKGLLDRTKKCKNKKQKKGIIDNIKQRKKTLLSCGNPADFAEASLKMLRDSGSTAMNLNYLPIARAFSRYWTEEEKKELSHYCITVLGREFSGLGVSGLDVSANNEAIKTIGVCGVEEHVRQLFRVQNKSCYRSALLYAFGCAGQELDWICGEVEADIRNGGTQQDSMQALGLALSHAALEPERAGTLAVTLAGLIAGGTLDQNAVVLSVIALGELCDQRPEHSPRVDAEIAQAARQAVGGIPVTYGEETAKYSMNARLVAEHLLLGNLLSDEDESYLLSVLYKS
ncbi:MAG: Hsp70 family protein [Oscillospiraceae bacterium]|nr:Hsp70 family protein [Oscillospiraceae bacterium]